MLTIRPATMDDAQRLFDWRNDPLTRAMSRNGEPIGWAEHVAWLEWTLAEPARAQLWIALLDGVPAGTGRYDYGSEIEFSWAVAPEWRGRGVALKIARGLMAIEPDFYGYIKAENVANQRVMRAAGMVMLKDGPLQRWRFQAEARVAA